MNKKAVCCHKRKVLNVTSSLFCIYWHYFYDNYSFSLENSKEKKLQLVLVDQEEVAFQIHREHKHQAYFLGEALQMAKNIYPLQERQEVKRDNAGFYS